MRTLPPHTDDGGARRPPRPPRAAALLALLAAPLLTACAALPVGPWRAAPDPADPPTLHLTWQADPTTTMTIQWLAEPTEAPPRVWYAREDADGQVAAGAEAWRLEEGATHPFPRSDLHVHRVELTELAPGARYRFGLARGGPAYRFQTLPADADEPVRFVSGGDVDVRRRSVRTHRQAALREPLFALLGGDLSYADGRDAARKARFLEQWRAHMITADGRLIPMLATIGNHEVRGGYEQDRSQAPFFYALFDGLYPERGYAALDAGDYLSLILLDSNHTTPVEGEQAAWLAEALAARRDVDHLIAAYHVAAFPSARSFDRPLQAAIREHWVPLFEEHQVSVVLHHHDHTYKRTHRIRDGAVDPDDGILYLGDGAWGRYLRRPRDPDEEWYLARTARVHHFIETTLHGAERTHKVIDHRGREVDRYPPAD